MTDTLKSICEQCIQLRDPQLEFIPSELRRHKEIILRDLREIVSAASAEQEKTVTVLAGGVFESILFSFIQGQIEYIAVRRGGSFTFDPEGNLDNYVSIFNRFFSGVFSIPDIVIDYRNFVHINQELQYPSDVCRVAASEMLRLLDALLGKLTEYARS
jgi:hypothetical protein